MKPIIESFLISWKVEVLERVTIKKRGRIHHVNSTDLEEREKKEKNNN